MGGAEGYRRRRRGVTGGRWVRRSSRQSLNLACLPTSPRCAAESARVPVPGAPVARGSVRTIFPEPAAPAGGQPAGLRVPSLSACALRAARPPGVEPSPRLLRVSVWQGGFARRIALTPGLGGEPFYFQTLLARRGRAGGGGSRGSPDRRGPAAGPAGRWPPPPGLTAGQ